MSNDFYGAFNTEIDLRYELSRILNGSFLETAKATYGLLRSMNVDSSNNLVKCPCVDKTTNEADRDYFCPICMGERYIWTEILVKFYRVSLSDADHGNTTVWTKTKEYGQVNISSHVFYFEFDTQIKRTDKIIDLKLDLEGNIIQPAKRDTIWNINSLMNYRSDRGRVEFIKVFCNNEDVKYLQAPPIG